MKKNLVTKILVIFVLGLILSGCETTKSSNKDNNSIKFWNKAYNENPNLILGFNKEYELNIDFACYNMCLQGVRGGMTSSQLEKFCRTQCPYRK